MLVLFLRYSALVLKPVTDPVISKDGDNVTLEIQPPGALTAMTWTFSPTGITVVSWSGSAPVIGTGYVNRVTLSTTTGSLGLSSVNGSDSGVYLFRGNTAVSGNPEDIDGNVTLEVYGKSMKNTSINNVWVGEADQYTLPPHSSKES